MTLLAREVSVVRGCMFLKIILPRLKPSYTMLDVIVAPETASTAALSWNVSRIFLPLNAAWNAATSCVFHCTLPLLGRAIGMNATIVPLESIL